MTVTYDIEIHDPDKNIDYDLAATVSLDIYGRLDCIERVVLIGGLIWIAKRGMPFQPTSPEDARAQGAELWERFDVEIEEKVWREIREQMVA